MNRREFLVATAAAAFADRKAGAGDAIEVVHSRSSYALLLNDIEPGHDEFPREKEAFEIAWELKRIVELRSLPWSEDFRGFSPFPASHEAVAEGIRKARFDPSDTSVAAGLQKWLDSLGQIRAARFYVLPDDEVRYEIASGHEYRVGRWHQKWSAGKITEFAPIEETVTTAQLPLFRDITGWAFRESDSFLQQLSKGIPWWRAHIDSATGIDVHGHNGIAAGDIDNDGIDEIYVCQPGGLPNRLYKNRGDGRLEDITDHAGVGVLDPTSAALFIDFRNTGRQDLVVLRPDGPLLFLNMGGNRFEFKPGVFRFRTTPQGSFTGMAAADYDRDGHVDLYLCTYSFFRDTTQYRYPSPYRDARNGPPNFLFRNQLTESGDGMFLDVTAEAGLNQNNDRFSFAPAWCDYNGDGWPDLFVANDFGRKNLYRNDHGKFRDVAAEAGVEDMGDGMSASWFDYDGDGRPDLYVSNMWSDAGQRIVAEKNFKPAQGPDGAGWRRHAKGNSLYRNRGDGTFEETGAAEGVEMGRWAWGSEGIDFDNDGIPEIFITTGMLTNSSETDLESFFWRKVAAQSPPTNSPHANYENGWNALSQAVHEQYSEAGRQPNVFYVRRGGRYYDFSGVSGLDFADDSRAFAVTDLDGDGNPDLLLKSRLGPQVRVFRNDSTNGRRAIAFRLRGSKSNRDAIGARVEVDGKVKFVQAGSGYLSQHTKVLHFGLGEARMAETIRIQWPSGALQEFQRLAAGFRYDIDEGSPQVRQDPFKPGTEIPAGGSPGDNSTQFGDTWLLEPLPLPETVDGPGIIRLSALSPERAEWYGLFCRYLFDLRADLKLPVWFLVDDAGRAHKIYFTAPAPLAIKNDLELLQSPSRAALALPHAGKFYTPPARNYAALGAAFFAAGFGDQALQYLLLAPQTDAKNLFAIGQIHLEARRWDPARRYYEKGVALAPDAADGWNNLGAVELGAGNYRTALARCQKSLSLRPDSLSALINTGEAYIALNDAASAERTFRRALEISPDDPAAANQMGELCVRLGRDSEAKTWFQRALTGRRTYAPAINNLGALYVRAGQPNDAIAAFRYGTEVAPDEESFYLNLGSLYASLGNLSAARETVQRLLVRNPGNTRAIRVLREWEGR